MIGCEICGCCDWTRIDAVWKRCDGCYRLEMVIRKLPCSICQTLTRKRAKGNTPICRTCKKSNNSRPIDFICQTPDCDSELNKQNNPRGYCRQCLWEMENWNNKDAHLWKSEALSLMGNEIKRKNLLEKLKLKYPKLRRERLDNWLSRQIKVKKVKRTQYGIYCRVQ